MCTIAQIILAIRSDNRDIWDYVSDIKYKFNLNLWQLTKFYQSTGSIFL